MQTTIAVSRETHKRLAKICPKNKTYDALINELIDNQNTEADNTRND